MTKWDRIMRLLIGFLGVQGSGALATRISDHRGQVSRYRHDTDQILVAGETLTLTIGGVVIHKKEGGIMLTRGAIT